MSAPEHLASNLRRLRSLQNLSQQAAAAAADLPRPTWATLESGAANPTLAVLSRVAAGLQVSMEELISPPRSAVRLVHAADNPGKKRRGGSMRPLLPEQIAGLSISRVELHGGGQITGAPHTQGTREYLTCETGRMDLIASGERYALHPGDMLVFRGDQRHSYLNPDPRKPCVAISVVCFGSGAL